MVSLSFPQAPLLRIFTKMIQLKQQRMSRLASHPYTNKKGTPSFLEAPLLHVLYCNTII